MEDMKESVRKTALMVTEENVLCYNSDVAKILRIPRQSIGAFLNHHYREWGLTKSARSRRGDCAYEKDTTATENLVGINNEDDIRDKLREVTLQIVGKKGYALSKDVAKITGISHASAAMYLKHNFSDWGLRQEYGGNIFRHKYVRDAEKLRPYFKCKIPALPNLAILFSDEPMKREHEINEENIIKVEKEFLKVELKHELLLKGQEASQSHVETLLDNEIIHKDTQPESKSKKEEALPQRLKRIIDELHKKEERVDLIKIKQAIEEDFGRKPDMDLMKEAVNTYNKGIKDGEYFWNIKGYSTRRKSI